jgi:hypothetical protein
MEWAIAGLAHAQARNAVGLLALIQPVEGSENNFGGLSGLDDLGSFSFLLHVQQREGDMCVPAELALEDLGLIVPRQTLAFGAVESDSDVLNLLNLVHLTP